MKSSWETRLKRLTGMIFSMLVSVVAVQADVGVRLGNGFGLGRR